MQAMRHPAAPQALADAAPPGAAVTPSGNASTGHPAGADRLPAFLDKICGPAELAARVAALPAPVVFTNGVFDILHRGHVSYLAQARALGASLVLGLNSDVSARSLGKGPDRPLNGELDRACVLAALESVSLVALFDESTPCALLQRVRPQLYVKGGDYDIEQLEETRLVRSWGGQALALPFVDGYSTTALVRRIRA
jgi:rfaE bifunctional protein nucleotidyltransferase chain/domain